jgi:hypothetical protein
MPTIILQGDWWDALSTNGQVSDGMSLMACTGLAYAVATSLWQPQSVERISGVARSLWKITARVVACAARRVRLCKTRLGLAQGAGAAAFSLADEMDLVSLEDDAKAVMASLQSWIANIDSLSLTPRAYLGSTAMWHACWILAARDLRGLPREDEDVQQSAARILELCTAAVGGKIEFLNWVRLFARDISGSES